MDNFLSILLSVLALLVGLSGWVVFAYERITAGPRLRGKILTIIVGQVSFPQNRSIKEFTSYLVYLYITNLRNNSVHILDYEMEVDFGDGFHRLTRAYGADAVPSYTFTDAEGKEIAIPDFQKKLIYKNTESIGFGQLYRGFILFVGDTEFHGKEVKRYRITCIDALGKRHQFTSTPKELGNISLLQEMTGMIIPD